MNSFKEFKIKIISNFIFSLIGMLKLQKSLALFTSFIIKTNTKHDQNFQVKLSEKFH